MYPVAEPLEMLLPMSLYGENCSQQPVQVEGGVSPEPDNTPLLWKVQHRSDSLAHGAKVASVSTLVVRTFISFENNITQKKLFQDCKMCFHLRRRMHPSIMLPYMGTTQRNTLLISNQPSCNSHSLLGSSVCKNEGCPFSIQTDPTKKIKYNHPAFLSSIFFA